MSGITARLDRSVAVGLIVAVVFTALAHGAVEFWAISVFELIIAGLLLLWGIKFVASGSLSIRIPPATLPIIALVALGLLQSIAVQTAEGPRLSLSMDVEATRASVTVLVSLLVSFVIAVNFIASRERLRALVGFLIIYGLAMAVFALVQHFTWNGHIYWLRPLTAQNATPFGSFVNRNHFAGYMEMLMPVPVALLITGAARKDSRLFYVFAATMMAVAAVATLSRGGIISMGAQMIFLAVLGFRRTGRAREGRFSFMLHPLAFIPLIAAAITVGVIWIASEPVVNRIIRSGLVGDDPKAQTFFTSRGWIWRDTLTMISSNPIVGVGLGAYETAYPIYSQDDGTITLGQSYSVDRAHNDYLQALSDCGVAGLGIALWFIVTIFRATLRGAKSRDPLLAGLALGCGAGVFGLLVHSLFDFNLQLPSNALLFLLLSAVISHIAEVGAGHARARKNIIERSVQVEAVGF